MQERKMTYLLTWIPRALKIKGWVMLGEVLQPGKPPVHHFIKVYPPVLNHVIPKRQFEHIIIMRINRQIINHEKKLMEMGGGEDILLQRESTSPIIQEILPEVITTSLINTSLNKSTIYR